MKVLTIFICKIIIFILKLLKRGSSLPGKIALKMNKNIMKSFILPKTVIAVTGSSGKGSTATMIAEVCRKLGYTCCFNDKGSNLEYAIATMLLDNCDLKGKIKQDILVYEIDERYAKYVFKNIVPNYVVITNITRDQPPRQGNFDLVYEEIYKALDSSMHLILNADDPYIQKFNLDEKFKVSYYTLDKNKYSHKDNKFTNLNIYYCPKCHTKLKYDYYHFETYGGFRCEKCGLKNPCCISHITSLDYNKKIMTIDGKYKIQLQYDILYCVYNTMAVFALSKLLDFDLNRVCEILSCMAGNNKIYNNYEINNRKVYVLNNKNENSTTFNQSILYTLRNKNSKIIIIGWKEISRRYNFDDLSWLYDIDFELLNNKTVKKIICVGDNCYDIATRIKYAGINEKNIYTFDNLELSMKEINKGKDDIVAIVNFDYVQPFNDIIKGDVK